MRITQILASECSHSNSRDQIRAICWIFQEPSMDISNCLCIIQLIKIRIYCKMPPWQGCEMCNNMWTLASVRIQNMLVCSQNIFLLHNFGFHVWQQNLIHLERLKKFQFPNWRINCWNVFQSTKYFPACLHSNEIPPGKTTISSDMLWVSHIRQYDNFLWFSL